MSSRGFIGFYSGESTRGLYYKNGATLLELGFDTINFLAKVDYDRFKLRAKKWMEQTRPYIDGDPSKPIGEWKELREFLESSEDEVPIALQYDFSEFLFNSVFCCDAYIINLDTNELEYYVGPNFDKNENGRYANSPSESFEQFNRVLPEMRESWAQKGAPPEEVEASLLKNYGVRKILSASISLVKEMKPQEIRRLTYCFDWVMSMVLGRKWFREFLPLDELFIRYNSDLDQYYEVDMETITKEDREQLIKAERDRTEEMLTADDFDEEESYREMLIKAG